MPAVARGSGQDTVSTGHSCTGTTNTDKCSTDVFVNDKGACRKGDAIKVHTHKVGKNCVNHTETIKAGSATVFVNNIPISRNGDSADAGSISSGSPTVFAGDSSSTVSANEPPIAIASSSTITKNNIKYFSTDDFKFTDADGNSVKAVIITKLPKVGVLKVGTAKVKANQSIPASSIPAMSYVPDKSRKGVVAAAIGFKIQDTGGTANNGKDTSSESTITITITPK